MSGCRESPILPVPQARHARDIAHFEGEAHRKGRPFEAGVQDRRTPDRVVADGQEESAVSEVVSTFQVWAAAGPGGRYGRGLC